VSELKVNKITPSTGTQVELEATTVLVDGTLSVGTVNNATGVSLQHNGSTKVATTSTGATVTGTVTATAFSGNGAGLTGVIAAGSGGSTSTGGLSVIAASGGGGVGGIDFYTNGTAGANIRGSCANNGDWNFDSNTLFIQNSTNRVGIGNISPANELDVTGTIRSQNVTVTQQVIGGFGAQGTGGTLNWDHASNARSGSGFTLLQSQATNGPAVGTASDYFHPFSFEYGAKDGTGNLCQFAFPYATPLAGVHVRNKYDGTWTAWRNLVSQPSSATPMVTVTATGVGIAKAAPATALDVTGAITSSGTINANAGITFPATAAVSTLANVLDDYEEGTWTPAYGMLGGTPALGAITYNATSTGGSYVKIGSRVFVNGRITVTTGATSATGTYGVITGLPFTVSGVHSVTVGYRNTSGWAGTFPATGYTYTSGFYLMTNAYAYLGPAAMGAATPPLSGTDIMFSLNYTTTQ
jgi:hypothetical protein